ncbi:Cathepsin D [Galdieria sulphuraria]|nr:Cathepsin D [Galdieria sulphuraria]
MLSELIDSCSQERDRTSRPYNYVFSDPTGRLVAKESLYRSSSRQLSSEIILKGGAEIVGGYYFQIQVGGQPIYVQIDTGSSTLVVPLIQQEQSYLATLRLVEQIPAISKFAAPAPVVKLAVPKMETVDSSLREYSVQATFAGADTETANFLVGKAAGVLGLAYSSLSCNPTCISPVFHQLVESFSLPNIFSVLINQDIGAFVVGGVNSSLYEGPIEYSSLANEQNPQFYDVTIESVQVNSNSLSIPSFNAIVDTGTTLIVASPYIFDALKEYFQTNFCNVPGLCPSSSNPGVTWFGTDYCVNLTPEELSQLPDIEFSLAGGVTLSLGPEHYMFHVSSNNIFSAASGSYCLGIQPSSQNLGPTSDGNEMILGNTLQLKYYLVFDRENKRIGFAKGKQLSS